MFLQHILEREERFKFTIIMLSAFSSCFSMHSLSILRSFSVWSVLMKEGHLAWGNRNLAQLSRKLEPSNSSQSQYFCLPSIPCREHQGGCISWLLPTGLLDTPTNTCCDWEEDLLCFTRRAAHLSTQGLKSAQNARKEVRERWQQSVLEVECWSPNYDPNLWTGLSLKMLF